MRFTIITNTTTIPRRGRDTPLMQELLQYFEYPFVWRALLGGMLIAVNCGLLGPFLVLRRLSFLSDGYGHIALTGVALGILLKINPLVTLFAVVLLGSVIIGWALRRNLLSDAAISLLISFGVGTSVIIIGVARGFNANLYSYLIGSLYTIVTVDLIYIAAALVLTLVYMGVFYRDLFMSIFNDELSQLTGVRRQQWAKRLFMLITAINVVITIRAIGILLVSSMVVIPSLTALKTAPSMRATVCRSVAIALVGLVCGVLLALLLDTPPSGTIVLVLLLCFTVTHLIYGRRGRRRSGNNLTRPKS